MGDSQTAAQAGDGTPDRAGNSFKKPPKKSASKNATDGPKKSKKRKADDPADKEPKKKKLKKDEPPKPKAPKPKAPVNVEQQCGVKLDNGGECARSLTCKSHSMGAKRAVGGRSLPYDQLLAMYQKRNAAKIQKAALSAAAPLLDDEPNTGPVDSDEEKDAVMAAIARSRPAPLEQHIFVPTTRKYKHIRMKEMLGNALGARGAGGGSIFGGPRPVHPDGSHGPDGSQAPAAETANGEGPSRKPSQSQQAQARAHQAGNAAAQVRKASVASAGGA
ncbi:SAGA-associated factor 73, partial [Lecanoromycetidae sp. Uapishka_2]